MFWIPILICTYPVHSPALCGDPLQGAPQPTYEACQEKISEAMDAYTAEARRLGLDEFASYRFTRRYIRKICEPQ